MTVFITFNLSRYLELGDLQNLEVNEVLSNLHSLDPRLLLLPHLEKVDCTDCTSLISPPYEVCKQGLQAIRKYYTDLEQSGGKTLPIVSATVIGHRMAGKTSLINSLKLQKRQLTYRNKEGIDDDTTEVFKISDITVDDSLLKVFDYGGDRVYHIAYHMTIRSKSIPIIVVNMKNYIELSTIHGCKEAARILVMDYMSHLYISCPHLGPPLLVLTHRDRFCDDDTFNACKTDLLTALRNLISDMLREEKLMRRGVSRLAKIALFSEPNAEIFPASDIFVTGETVESVKFVFQILSRLQIRAEPFFAVIPNFWEKLLIFFDQKTDVPYILLSEILKKFPSDENLTALRYMHDIGRILWFEHESSLRGFVFHRLAIVTDAVSLLFHHRSEDKWKSHVESQPNMISAGCETIPKAKYEKLVSRFMLSGVVDDIILKCRYNPQTFPYDVAVPLLRAFNLLCGPIHTTPRSTYIIPYYSSNWLDLKSNEDKLLQLRIDIDFLGFSPPSYAYNLVTCVYLAPFTDPGLDIKTARNGAMVCHGVIVSRVVHSTVNRRITVQVDTPVDELDSSWRQLMDTTDSIIRHLRSIWVAAYPICKFYCAHCLYLNKSEPELEVDPDWYSPLSSIDNDKPPSEQLGVLPSNADPVCCSNDQPTSGLLQVPRPLRFPCKCNI